MGSRNCPACRVDVNFDDAACPRCGQNLRIPSPAGSESRGGTEIIGGILGLAIPFFGVLFLMNSCNADEEQTPAQVAAEAAQSQHDHDRGLQCLSGWDGSLPALKEAVKAQLRDPDSFEHMKTIIAPKGHDNRHQVMMQYRARNGFGGMAVEYAKGSVSNIDCSLRVERIGQ